ncbi:MAG: energy-coupling factor transporter ATPase [Ruminococcaceae bacterium]|nr:energy-coupling factor transporter ATPase [Oscillospiraceae bacterium]
MENIIEVKNVTFEYKDNDKQKAVIKDFSLDIKRGSFTVILGHNGSGKSTLAKLLNGLYKPDSGDITVDGINTKDEENEIEIKRRVGMVFQNPDNQLVASVVEEDVAFGPENLGIDPKIIRERVDNALKAVDMYDFRRSAPHNLSGGQKQRVAIAGIIAMEPECIVLDEPTAMLDPRGRAEIINTVISLNKEKGITVVLITHFMEEAELADRVIVLGEGGIIADGTPKTVFSNAGLLKSVSLDVPQTTELLLRLNENGLKVPTSVISIEETANVIYNAVANLEEK